jgi:glyoxylase-like metal-dependent hydrolase (beta-lactamase superfamily II)
MEVHRILGERFESNIYILLAKKNTIIDSGTGLKSRVILREIERYIPIKKLNYIILTHMHFDHIGGAKKIAEASSAKTYISKVDGHFVAIKDRDATLARNFFASVPELELNFLVEGDEIDLGKEKLKVISTPGHTIGSISLYEPMNKLLFSGDTVFADGVGRYDLPTSNREQLKNSILKLSKLSTSVVYPGHGDTIGGEPKAVSEFLKLLAKSL